MAAVAVNHQSASAITEATGLPEPVLKLVICIFGSYGLALLYRRRVINKSPFAQHVYFAVSGLCIAAFCFGLGCIHSFVNIVLAFLVLRTGGPSLTTVVVILTLNLGYLVTGFVCMKVDDILHFHWTTTHCILCLRLTSLAWDYYDGAQKELSDDYKRTAIKEAPSLLQMLSYSYFYGGFLVGPQFSFKRYHVFVEGDLKESRKQDSSCVTAGVQRMAWGLFNAAGFLLLDTYINAEYLISDWYESRPLLTKYLYVALFGKVAFMKYLALFLLAEGACVLSGLSFNGVDQNGNLKWDGTCYVKVWEYETSYNCQQMINSFNIPTNLWIRRYVFKRFRIAGYSRNIAYVASLVFLSIWHGVDIGFFVAFLFQFILINIERQVDHIWQLLYGNKSFHEVPMYIGLPCLAVCLAYRHVIFSFAFAPFVLLYWSSIYKFYVATAYVPLLVVPAWMSLFPLIRTLAKKIADKEKKEN